MLELPAMYDAAVTKFSFRKTLPPAYLVPTTQKYVVIVTKFAKCIAECSAVPKPARLAGWSLSATFDQPTGLERFALAWIALARNQGRLLLCCCRVVGALSLYVFQNICSELVACCRWVCSSVLSSALNPK